MSYHSCYVSERKLRVASCDILTAIFSLIVQSPSPLTSQWGTTDRKVFGKQ
jgi:hypothetical protein